MTNEFHFTFAGLQSQLRVAIENGYQFLTCEGYCHAKTTGLVPEKTLVNRVDIDFSCKKARRMLQLFNALDVKATFFIRLHAPEYNPFDFENYLILKEIRDTGHEIGYHSEIVDQSVIWHENAAECLMRDIDVLNRMLEIRIKGVASHGGMTGLNNLDFWQDKKAADFGLLYEAYDKSDKFNLFDDSLYISDSEWVRWKCYQQGVLVTGDHRSLDEHALNGYPLIYLLTHSDTYFDRHFYE